MKKAEKTRKKIINTFYSLALTNDTLPNISEICNELDLNRSTFYNYFSNIDNLIESAGEDVLIESYTAYQYAVDYIEKNKNTKYFHLEQALEMILEKSFENRNAYLVLTSPKWNFPFKVSLREGIYDLVMSIIDDTKIENKYIADFIADGIISVQYKWLLNQDISKKEIQTFFSHVNNLIEIK